MCCICSLDYFSAAWLPTIISMLCNLTRSLISLVEFFIRLMVILKEQNITLWADELLFWQKSLFIQGIKYALVGGPWQPSEDIILLSVSACLHGDNLISVNTKVKGLVWVTHFHGLQYADFLNKTYFLVHLFWFQVTHIVLVLSYQFISLWDFSCHLSTVKVFCLFCLKHWN